MKYVEVIEIFFYESLALHPQFIRKIIKPRVLITLHRILNTNNQTEKIGKYGSISSLRIVSRLCKERVKYLESSKLFWHSGPYQANNDGNEQCN